MSDILKKIVAVKHEEIAQAQGLRPLAQVRTLRKAMPSMGRPVCRC